MKISERDFDRISFIPFEQDKAPNVEWIFEEHLNDKTLSMRGFYPIGAAGFEPTTPTTPK